MRFKLISLLVSLVFIPVAVLAQYIGLYLGKILYFIYEKIMFLNMPDFLLIIAPLAISGLNEAKEDFLNTILEVFKIQNEF